jgi:predicted O-linked N-acetylglucosamine transferase (SPINDLY family)
VDNRLELFAYGLAPVQISHLGYPGTLGTKFIDYFIADPVLIPEDKRDYYSEKIIYLPNSYQPNDNKRFISDKAITREEAELPIDSFVFCCFNDNYKITPKEFDIWMRLLNKVEGSVLWLLRSNSSAEMNMKREAVARGIDAERLVFAEKMPHAEHLARHRLADLFLDTFNVNAHTTASDALWAGLPIITKLGENFAARVAGSLLNAVGLPELITENESDYEALILDLSTNPKRLDEIKRKLADNLLSKPLFDTQKYTNHLETAYEQAFETYRKGRPPEVIIVPN